MPYNKKNHVEENTWSQERTTVNVEVATGFHYGL